MKIAICTHSPGFGVMPNELAQSVETRGLDALLFADHTHIPATPNTTAILGSFPKDGAVPPYAYVLDPFVAMTAAAAATTTLRVGTGVCLIPERDPIVTAKAIASIDLLSNGRVLFGIGAGWIPEEMANHGTDPARRWAVMNERIEAMRQIWTRDEAEFHGTHVAFDPIQSWPKPVQKPYPPILVGGEGTRVFDRVLAYGDEWMPEGRAPVDDLGRRITELQRRAADAGRTPIPVNVFSPPARRDHLERLREIGVHRVFLQVPWQERSEIERFLDEAAALSAALT